MNYNLSKTIKLTNPLVNFKIENETLIMIDNNYSVVLENGDRFEFIYDIFISDNNWFVNCLDNSLGLMNQNKDLKILIPNSPISHIDRLCKTALLSYDYSNDGYKRQLFDLKNKKLISNPIWARIEHSCFLNKSIFSSFKGIEIYKLDVENNIINWSLSLKNLHDNHSNQMLKYGEFQMEVNHFVGVVNGILWMDINVIMNGSFLLGLDAETGKCIHLLDTVENQNEVNYVALVPNRLPGGTFTTYDDKRNILFGFTHDHFHWQVDLAEKSPKIKMWSVEDEMKKHHAFVSAFMNCGISDSHIFFPVGSIGNTPQVFALNRDTLKVDWQCLLTEGGAYYTPTKVEVTETHLYVLDNIGTLHIFEKIEDN